MIYNHNGIARGVFLGLAICCYLWSCIGTGTVAAREKGPRQVWVDFDSFVPTAENALPDHAVKGWKYLGMKRLFRQSSGWVDMRPYPEKPSVFNYFKSYNCTYNNPHMGFQTYGYLEIDHTTAVKGNSLRYVTTGGVNSSGRYGRPLFSKAAYVGLREKGLDPLPGGETFVGHPYLYFMNTTMNQGNEPFFRARGKNRLSIYVKLPDTVTNDPRSKSAPQPRQTMTIGPYNGTGGHWYHHIYNQGGGWTHIQIDGHPNHNNAYSNAQAYPHPSYSVRNMGTDYFNSLHAFYLTFHPYEGVGTPPYSIWVDEISFSRDDEPQNCETINSPAVTWLPGKKRFEIGFSDKYKNNKDSHSRYQIRYAFAPITNATFSQATPVTILSDKRFKGLSMDPGGKVNKVWPYYQAVWAPFRLKSQDMESLAPGNVIYFAVKDLSQRPYDTGTFDAEGDLEKVPQAGNLERIRLIRRLDFQMPLKN